MKKTIKILAPCGMLGYGFPEESFMNGIAEEPDAIVVDAGSTDAGLHKLGAGVSIVSRMATKSDLERMIVHGLKMEIPVIIGSAGGTGTYDRVNWTKDIVDEILSEHRLNAKISLIRADISQVEVKNALRENKIIPLGRGIRPLTEQIVKETTSIVDQMGHEPIVEALVEGSEIISSAVFFRE